MRLRVNRGKIISSETMGDKAELIQTSNKNKKIGQDLVG